jgi:CRISPR-associated protein Csx14
MSHELRMRMDPLNPGQFFACCGLFDLLTTRAPEIQAWFTLNDQAPRSGSFVLSGVDPTAVQSLILDLSRGRYEAVDHPEKSISPVVAYIGSDKVELDWWLDEFRLTTTNLKCWAGQVTSIRLFEELTPLIDQNISLDEVLNSSMPTKSKFGADPRSAWTALNFGFSPDQHNQSAATYPIVEILAAFGLQGFRPDASDRKVFYSIWTVPLQASVARLAAFYPWDGLPRSEYSFEIAKRGQSYKYFTFSHLTERRVYFA